MQKPTWFHRSAIAAILTSTAIATSGCPKDQSLPQNTDPIPLAALPIELERAICEMYARCPIIPHERIFSPPIFLGTDVEKCMRRLAPLRDLGTVLGPPIGSVAELEQNLARGALTYDGAAARACIDELSAKCLTVPFGANFGAHILDAGSCRNVLRGTVPEGSCCLSGTDCADGSDCEVDYSSGEAVATCVRRPTPGEPCTFEPRCAATSDQDYVGCDLSGAVPTCRAATVTDGTREGEPCGLLESTAETSHYASCAAGLWCSWGSRHMDPIGVCRRPLAIGETCEHDRSACENGAACFGEGPNNSSFCIAVSEILLGEGETCSDNEAHCHQADGLSCEGGGTCVRAIGGLGDPCPMNDFVNGDFFCAPELRCRQRVCSKPPAVGDACGPSSGCGSLRCESRTCIEPSCPAEFPPPAPWAARTAMTIPRLHFAHAVHGGHIYTFGGASRSSTVTAIVESYDPATDRWARHPDMPAPRTLSFAVTLGESIHVIGAQSFDPTVASIHEVFDPISESWSERAPIPRPTPESRVEYVGGAAVDGHIFAVIYSEGFQRVNGRSVATYEYDPGTDLWRTRAAPPRSFDWSGAAAASARGKLYALTVVGFMGSADAAFAEYDPSSDVWTELDGFSARQQASLGGAGDDLLVVGGFDPGGQYLLDSVHRRGPDSDLWEQRPSLPIGLHSAAVAEVDGRVFVLGGSEWIRSRSPAGVIFERLRE